jgi:hypothetical protein
MQRVVEACMLGAHVGREHFPSAQSEACTVRSVHARLSSPWLMGARDMFLLTRKQHDVVSTTKVVGT